MKFLRRAAFTVLVILPLAEVVGHLFVQRTDAYQTLDRFVQTSDVLREKVGERPKMSLDFFGYSVRVSGPDGTAAFSASLEGSAGTGELSASLVKRGEWKIVLISLDGQAIQTSTLEPPPASNAEK